MNNRKSIFFNGCMLLLFFSFTVQNAVSQQIITRPSRLWHGFEQVNFLLDGAHAHYIKPSKPLPGNPWVWRARFPNRHIAMDSLLLKKGFYVAFINTDTDFSAPKKAMMAWNRFYHYLTSRLSFARKVALEGVGRGGLFVFGWAKRNPDKVSCIYAESPVCDIKSWAKGVNPINHLKDLAAYKVPILSVVSLDDKIVPPAENTLKLVHRYILWGGPATVYPVTQGPQSLQGHHFQIAHPDWWANFIYKCSYPVKDPLPYKNYFNVRNGLSHFYEKIKNNIPVTVAFLGGSITYNPGWRAKVCEYLSERFPQEKFHFMNAGIPSLGSLPDAFRLQRDILDSGRVDMMFVEAAVNDYGNGTDSVTQIRDLEGIVRHAKRNNPDMGIMLLSFADPTKLAVYGSRKIPVTVHNHELVASHYGLPSLNLAKEVYDKIKAGEFSWDYEFKSLHPAPYGETLYFESIKALLNCCFKRAAIHGNPAINKLPTAMNKYSFTTGQYYPIEKAQIVKGWRWVHDWHPKDHAQTRKGFVGVPVLEADTPGSMLKLTFKGTAIGIAILAGPYAGIVEYSIDGKRYKKMDLYTRWSANLYLPWYELFSGTLKNKKHVLRLRIFPDKNLKSKGTDCKIVYFLVNKE